MREDHREMLEKAFPAGFVIIVRKPNGKGYHTLKVNDADDDMLTDVFEEIKDGLGGFKPCHLVCSICGHEEDIDVEVERLDDIVFDVQCSKCGEMKASEPIYNEMYEDDDEDEDDMLIGADS